MAEESQKRILFNNLILIVPLQKFLKNEIKFNTKKQKKIND